MFLSLPKPATLVAAIALAACSPQPSGPSITEQPVTSMIDNASTFVSICLPIAQAPDQDARRALLQQNDFSARPLGWVRRVGSTAVLNTSPNPERPCVLSYSNVWPRKVFMQPLVESQLEKAGFEAVSETPVQASRTAQTKNFTKDGTTIMLRTTITGSGASWSLTNVR